MKKSNSRTNKKTKYQKNYKCQNSDKTVNVPMKTTEHDPSGGGLIGKTNDFPDNRLRRASHNHQKGPYESRKHALAGARRRQYSSTGRLSDKTSGALRVQRNHLHRQGWKLASDSQRRIHGLLVQHRSDTGRSHGHERTDVTHERG